MKNCFKKFSIMFVMLLAIIGVGTIQNESVANAATVGNSLTVAENGWKRYEDNNLNFSYVNVDYVTNGTNIFSGGSARKFSTLDVGKIQFNFTGTKLRLIFRAYNYGENPTITIDNNSTQMIPCRSYNGYMVLVYENISLTNEEHQVTIACNKVPHIFDAIDIDENGYLAPYSEVENSISLGNSSLELIVGDSEQLTAATTPAGIGVTWTSSDSSVATVDENGNVTATGEGTCTITATITGGLTATCTVTVTELTTPTDPQSDGTLFIELVDGNIKSYDVSGDEITNFMNWYKNRDLDGSESPIYKFTKGSYKDYIVHDKIVWFEVR